MQVSPVVCKPGIVYSCQSEHVAVQKSGCKADYLSGSDK